MLEPATGIASRIATTSTASVEKPSIKATIQILGSNFICCSILTHPVRAAVCLIGLAQILLCCFGSYGDLHPYIAIGMELHERGHRVTIASSAVYRAKVPWPSASASTP